MANQLFGGKRTHVSDIIYSVGEPVDILQPDNTATENRYGKVSDTDRSFSKVDEEHARRIYETDNDEQSQQIVEGGRLDEDTPQIAMMHDTVADTGYHLRFPDGSEYELDREVPKDTHTQFRATLIQ